MEPTVWIYPAILAVSGILSLGLTPLALRLALSKQVLDHPGGYKEQASPIPYLGGIAIVTAFSIAILLAGLFGATPPGFFQLGVVIGLGLALAMLGLVDDLRGLNPFLRFAVQSGAAVSVWYVGVGVAIFPQEIINALFTVLWVVGITNAFNLLDNMDGLSAGIAAIASFFFFLIAAFNGQFAIAAFSIALTGCAIGFLRHNFHPARIYMGDAGALFLGFLLAVIGVKLRFEAPTQITFMVPILVLGIPILDTSLVVITRVLHRRNPLVGGRDHTSHRLVFVGIPVPATVALIYGASVALGWLAIIMSRIDLGTGYILMSLVLTVAVFVEVLLALVPVYETSRRKRMMIMEVKEHEEPPVEQDAATIRAN